MSTIESLRLKRIRDGREDHEYLHELESRGRGARARAVAERHGLDHADLTQFPVDMAAAYLLGTTAA